MKKFLAAFLCLLGVISIHGQGVQPIVAIHDSEFTRALESLPATGATPTGTGYTGNQWWPKQWHYFVMPNAVKEAMRSDGTAYTVVGDSDILAGVLTNADGSPKYPILISLGAEAIDNGEIAALTNYVAAGGFLFVGGSAFSRNTNGTTRGDFAIANAMGIHMVRSALTNWYMDDNFAISANHRLVANIPSGTWPWQMPESSEEISWPMDIHLIGETPNATTPGLPHMVWQVQTTNATVIAQGDNGIPYLIVQPYGKGWFIYDAALQPLIGHGGWSPGMYAYSIFRNAIQWAFQSAGLPVVKNSPWPYPYDAAVIFRHDMEAIPVNMNGIKSSAQFENTNGAYGDYYLCTGTVRQNMPTNTTLPSVNSNTVIAALKLAITNYGATIYPHNGGLTNINPFYKNTLGQGLVPIEPYLNTIIPNGWLTVFEPYGASGIAPPLNTNAFDYDYWHWSPDEILGVTNLLGGFTNASVYAFTSISNSYNDVAGWHLTNSGPRAWCAPYFNATKEGSYQIEQALGIQVTGDDKLTPFPHWIFSTQTPDQYYSILSEPVSDWFVTSPYVQISQAMENGHTAATIQAGVDFYYSMGALINFYCHSTSGGAGYDGALPGFYTTYSLSKPRVWSTNAAGIYYWWLQRSNAQVTVSFTNSGVQSVATLAISGNSNTNAAVELVVPGATYASLQVSTNGVLAGTSVYRTNGAIVKLLVGTTVTNAVVSYILPPTVQNNFYAMSQSGSLAVTAPGVLTNGSTSATVVLAGGPSNGTLTLNADGSFTYMPTNNFTGVDNFTYQAVSGSLTSSVATATIMVTASGGLFYDDWTRPANSSSIFPWVSKLGAWGVTNNVLVGSGSLDNYAYAYYDANWTNYSVQAQLQFSSSNAWGGAIAGRLNSVTGARYTMWIYPENSPGGPRNGTATMQIIKYANWTGFVAQNVIRLPGSLGTNAHIAKLTFQGTNVIAYYDGTQVTNLLDNGAFDGQPALVGGGIDVELYTLTPTTFTMKADNVIVSTLTVANNDAYSGPQNATLRVSAPGVLVNDSSSGGAMTAQLASGPIHGTLTLTNNGGFAYVPVNGYVGTDNFTYRAVEGTATSGVATVTITLTSTSSIPITVTNDVYTALTNTILNMSAPGVLTNDVGGSGPLTAILAGAPAYGSLALSNNGGFRYTPANNFTGVDLFTYQATDGQTTSTVATAAAVVVPAGRLFNDTFVRPANTTTIFPWTVKAATPSPGVVPNPSGIWIITNNTFRGTSTSFYTYTLAYLDRPAWTNYSIQAQVSVPTTIAVGAGLGGRLNSQTGARYAVWMKPENAPDGPPNETGLFQVASVVLYKYSDWTTFKLNEVVVGQVGTNQHTLKATFQGNSIRAYLDGNLVTNWIDDGSIDGQPAYLSGGMDVEAYAFTNAYPPTISNLVVETTSPVTLASSDTYTNTVNTTLTVGAPGVLVNDIAGGNGSLTALLVTGPAFGSLVFSNNGGFVYTPSNNFAGIDSFTYQATDGQTTSAVVTAQITVLPSGYLFYDGFKRANNSSSIFPWVNQRGAWSITNSMLLGTCALNDYGYAYYDNASWTDYAVQARIRYPANNVWGGAVGGRLNPATGARYTVWVYPENSPLATGGQATLQIIKYTNWTGYAEQNLVQLPPVGTNWHDLKLAFKSNNIVAYFDGNRITNLVDNGTFDGQPALTNGGISVDMYAATPTTYTMSVSNVVVVPLMFNPAYSTRQNIALTVTNPGVLSGNTDVFGTNLTAAVLTGPFNGTLNLSTNGGFTYTPSNNFVGADSFTFQASDKANNLGAATATINVLPITNILTVTVNNTNRLYGSTNPVFTVSYSGFINGDTAGVLSGTPGLTTSAATNSPAGVYTITNTIGTLSATNYIFSFANGTLTVNPAALVINVTSVNRAYGATNPVFTATYSGFLNGDTASVLSGAPSLTTGATTNSPVGSYTITNMAGTLSATNYSFTFTNGTLTVAPAALGVTANNTNRIYGSTNPVFTVSYSGFVNGDTASVLSGAPGLTTVAATSSPVGSYAITNMAGTLSATNYSFTFTNGTLTVNPALLGVTANNTNRIYGSTNPVFTVSYSGFVNGDTASVLSGAPGLTTVAATNSPVGSYAITNMAGTLVATNYALSFTNGTLTVNPALLTITASNRSKAYGQAVVFAGTEFSTGGLRNSDAVTSVSLSSAGAAAGAAVNGSPYSIVVTNAAGTGLTNYVLSFTNGSLTVNPAVLGVTANNTNRTYGSANPAFTVSYAGFVNGDTASVLSGTPSLTTVAATNSPVGSYAITNMAGTLSATNYSFTFTNGTLTVNPALLGVTANNTNRTYGSTNPVFTAMYSGFVNGDTASVLSGAPSLMTAATTSSPVGSYAITNTAGTLAATNYTLSFTNGTLTVNSALLGVTANNTNRIYGSTNPVFTVSYAGFVNGDTASVLSGVPSLTTGAAKSSPVGSYAITNMAGTLSATNYSFTFTNGTLTVNPALLGVTANNTNRIYGSTNPVFTVSYAGFVNGDTASVLSGVPSLMTAATTSSPVGSYAITNTAGTLVATNYALSFTNGSLTVTSAALGVTANNTNRVYGSTNPVFTVSYSGFVNGDTASVLSGAPGLTTVAATNSPVGSYAITNMAGTLVATNYALSFTNGTLTVNPAVLGVTANNTNRVYGSPNPVFSYTASGFVNGDTASVLSGTPGLTTVAVTNSPVGSYQIAATNGTLTSTNYSFSFTNGTLTVNLGTLLVMWPVPDSIVYGTPLGLSQNNATSAIPGTVAYHPTNGTVLAAGTNMLFAVYTATDTNYAVTNLSVALVVTPAVLGVTASNATRMYGQTNPVLGGTLNGLQNSDNITATYATEAAANSPAGSYAIVPALTDPNSRLVNYNVTTNNGTLTVNPALLGVTANNTNRIYGSTNPVFTVSYAGFVNGDTASVLSGAPGLTTVAATNSPVGSYAITNTAGTLVATNYALSFTNGTLTVNPALLTITASNRSKAYGQAVVFAGTEISVSGLTNGDTVSGVTLTSSGAAANAGVAGSPYAINGTNAAGTGLTNYTIGYQPGILSVSAPSLTVRAADQTRMYGLTNPVLTALFSGFVNSEDSGVLGGSPALSTAAVPGSPVGGYPITLAPGTLSNMNYSFVYSNGTLTVTSAPVPVIYAIGLTNRIITLTWSSVAGATYGLQSTTNLTGTGWSPASASVVAAGAMASQTNAVGSGPVQFYRVQLIPADQ